MRSNVLKFMAVFILYHFTGTVLCSPMRNLKAEGKSIPFLGLEEPLNFGLQLIPTFSVPIFFVPLLKHNDTYFKVVPTIPKAFWNFGLQIIPTISVPILFTPVLKQNDTRHSEVLPTKTLLNNEITKLLTNNANANGLEENEINKDEEIKKTLHVPDVTPDRTTELNIETTTDELETTTTEDPLDRTGVSPQVLASLLG